MTQQEIEKYQEAIDLIDTEYLKQYNVENLELLFEEWKQYIGKDNATRREWQELLVYFYRSEGNWGNTLNEHLAEWLDCRFELYFESVFEDGDTINIDMTQLDTTFLEYKEYIEKDDATCERWADALCEMFVFNYFLDDTKDNGLSERLAEWLFLSDKFIERIEKDKSIRERITEALCDMYSHKDGWGHRVNELLAKRLLPSMHRCRAYVGKLLEKDYDYMKAYKTDEADCFAEELNNYIKNDIDIEDDVLTCLLELVVNEVNFKLAEKNYDYMDSESLACMVDSLSMSHELDDRQRNGDLWVAMSLCYGSDSTTYIGDTVSAGSNAYTEYADSEAKFIYSKRIYEYLCENDYIYLEPERLQEAATVLEKNDIRKVKNIDCSGFWIYTQKDYDDLCVKTALALYYCYSKLGQEKKALKELKALGVTNTQKTFFVFDTIEVPNPLCSITGTKTDKAFADKKETDKPAKKEGKGRGGRKPKTFFQKAMITLKKMF